MSPQEKAALTRTGPRRVQIRRVKGWRMPENAVAVTRGKHRKYGNPFTLESYYEAGYREDESTAARHCVDAFRAWMLGEHHWAHGQPMPPPPDITPLRGKNLGCFCPLDSPCHADVLLELANR